MPSVAAILHYPDLSASRIDRIEALVHDAALRVALRELATAAGRWRGSARSDEPARWVAAYEAHEDSFVPPPPLPSLLYALRLPHGVMVAFGRDAARVHPFVDLHDFAHRRRVREAVLAVLGALWHALGAVDCIVSHAVHPIIYELSELQGYHDVLGADHGECGGELTDPRALFDPHAPSVSGWWRAPAPPVADRSLT